MEVTCLPWRWAHPTTPAAPSAWAQAWVGHGAGLWPREASAESPPPSSLLSRRSRFQGEILALVLDPPTPGDWGTFHLTLDLPCTRDMPEDLDCG